MTEMKDSGIEWLGLIPSHWKICRVKNIFSLRNEKNYLPLADVQLLSLYADVGVFKHGEFEEKGNKAVTAEGYKEVYPDDIVVNIILAWMGAIGRSDYRGVTSPAYDIYFPEKNICSKFYHYLFRTTGFAGECYKYGRGIMEMRWRTYSAEFKAIKIPLPPLAEQKKITDFLDKKCTAIDSALDAAKKLVEKLREYKKSLITETVTKGLNPSAEMQDSGIEWLGDIPSHWKICRLKYFLQNKKGSMRVGPFGSQLKGTDFIESGYPVYNQRTVLDNNFYNSTIFISEEKFNQLKNFSISVGDILITTRGSIGKIAVVPSDAEIGVIHPCIIKFSIDRLKINDAFLKYIFNDTEIVLNQLLIASNETTISVVYSESLKNIKIPFPPPMDEQKKIADFLDKKCAAIDESICRREKLIEKLTEYKKSLIYEAVTGKLEV